uniref:deleted in malignant brain tumors 1 protein-like n=1 Tax=Oncorhynchus gorbuscha TaxID=8017 RepID=UPI001EAE9784|nr:deleted in malignant brain tumors 1 protein-like [Oncorhynchus gorbuscha]
MAFWALSDKLAPLGPSQTSWLHYGPLSQAGSSRALSDKLAPLGPSQTSWLHYGPLRQAGSSRALSAIWLHEGRLAERALISRLKASVHQSSTVSSTKLIECSTNSFSPESVRLVDGAGLCSGRVEVKSNQSWASVCEADFDRQDAEVVCRDVGCGAPAALQGGLYGEGEGQTWDKEFQCKGKESLLLDCDTSDRENNTCLPGNAVGLTCSEPDDVRLVGGGSRCAGGVEWYDQGEWRTVGADDRDQENVAVVVCRQLGCGSTVSVPPGNTTREFRVSCSGSESSLRECRRSYGLLPGLTVICSDLLVQPDIFLTDPMGGVFRGHQGPEMFRGYNFTITCSTQPQYPGGSFLLTFTGSNRTQTQPAVNHSAAFLFPAADDSHQGNYSCVYDNYVFSHNFSSESELLFLTITASPLPGFIIRHVVVLLILLTTITTSYLYYKPTRRQKRVNRVSSMDLYVNAMEMVSLSSRAEAGPGEERAAQGRSESDIRRDDERLQTWFLCGSK